MMKITLLILALWGMSVSNLLSQGTANDNCDQALSIGLVSNMSFTTDTATTSGPQHPSCFTSGTSSVHNDIWYRYTAMADAYLEWSTCNSANFDTRLVVYQTETGCMPTEDDLIACNDDSNPDCDQFTSIVKFWVQNGKSYLLRLGGYGEGNTISSGTGTFNLLSVTPPPLNDNCANAIPVSLGENQAFHTINANTDGPEHLNASCFSFGNDLVNLDIWYRYTASENLTLRWSTCDLTNFDTRLAVYKAESSCPLSDNDLLICNDDGAGCSDFTSSLLFDVQKDSTYLLRLGGFNENATGSGYFDLESVLRPEAPANDLCNNAVTVNTVGPATADNGQGRISGTTMFANQNGFTSECHNAGEYADVWYTFNNNGQKDLELRFNRLSPDAGFVVDLYQSCDSAFTFGSFTDVCFDLEPSSPDSQVFQIMGLADVPTFYWLRVATRMTYDPPGNFTFTLVDNQLTTSTKDLDKYDLNFIPNPIGQQEGFLQMELTEPALLSYTIYNTIGKKMQRMHQFPLNAGRHHILVDVSKLGRGIYLMHVQIGDRQQTLRLIRT